MKQNPFPRLKLGKYKIFTLLCFAIHFHFSSFFLFSFSCSFYNSRFCCFYCFCEALHFNYFNFVFSIIIIIVIILCVSYILFLLYSYPFSLLLSSNKCDVNEAMDCFVRRVYATKPPTAAVVACGKCLRFDCAYLRG